MNRFSLGIAQLVPTGIFFGLGGAWLCDVTSRHDRASRVGVDVVAGTVGTVYAVPSDRVYDGTTEATMLVDVETSIDGATWFLAATIEVPTGTQLLVRRSR